MSQESFFFFFFLTPLMYSSLYVYIIYKRNVDLEWFLVFGNLLLSGGGPSVLPLKINYKKTTFKLYI